MEFPSPFTKVCLVLAATPIGNVGDASPRLTVALQEAELIACEDTRRLRDLARRLETDITGRLLAYHEHNEAHLTAEVLANAKNGIKVLQVSDAGMPGISDPGFRLAHQASFAGVPFTVLPGPSAPLLALVASGLPTDSFRFLGFLPRKPQALYQTLQSLCCETQTLIFLESPRRLLDTLAAFQEVFGSHRPVAVARELTKIHEEILRGSLAEVLASLKSRAEVLGEIVIVLGGYSPSPNQESQLSSDILQKFEQLIQTGLRAKDAAKLLSQWFGVPAKELYEARFSH